MMKINTMSLFVFLFVSFLPPAVFPGSSCRGGEAADIAGKIVERSGVRGGLAVHVGCGNGRLTAALGAAGDFTVRGLDADAAAVDAAREHIVSRGLYGRVSVERYGGTRLPFSEDLVNLLVVEKAPGLPRQEMLRVLAPGGSLLVPGKKEWTVTVKPRPKDIDDWTHYLHGPDGNCVSSDTRIGIPRRLRWTAGPRWALHHNRVPSVSAMVAAGGKLFYIVNDVLPGATGMPSRWWLCCRDAFNGIRRWHIPMKRWGWRAWTDRPVTRYRNIGGRFNQPTYVKRSLVAADGRVYATLRFGGPVSLIDAASGEIMDTFAAVENVDELVLAGDILVAAVQETDLEKRKEMARRAVKAKKPPGPTKKRIVAMDAATGRLLWKSGPYEGIDANRGFLNVHRHLNPVTGGGRVYIVTRDALAALDLKTGDEAWTAARPAATEHKTRYEMNASDMVTTIYHDGVFLFAQMDPGKRLGWLDEKAAVFACAADTGKKLWQRPCVSWGWASPPDLFVVDGLVWIQKHGGVLQALRPRTGQVVSERQSFRTFDIKHHHRCYRNKATPRFMLSSWRGLELVPWEKGATSTYNHWWFRSACRLGFLPANGLIYNAPDPCQCYVAARLGGFNALAPAAPGSGEHGGPDGAGRLEKGPACGRVALTPPADQAAAWPAYRHDSFRSGCTEADVSGQLATAWHYKTNGIPSPVVTGGGRVYFSVPAAFSVRALDASSGREAWTFRAGAAVDTPPTYWRGLLLFGCRDGRVYCLRAADGTPAWRFDAAGTDLVVDGDRLESPRPVHGSVIVENGKVYFTAGRSTFLDGGIAAWVLDAATGKVASVRPISTAEVDSADPDVRVTRMGGPGFSTDVLVSNGRSLFIRREAVFEDALPGTDTRPQVSPISSFLDHTWFNRASQWRVGNSAYGDCLAFDGRTVYAFTAYDSVRKRSADRSFFSPGGDGYRLAAVDIGRGEGKKDARRWRRTVPVLVTSLVGAGDRLFVGGAPDETPAEDPWKNIEGRGTGVLLVVSAESGATASERTLPAPPVTDGLSAAGGRLYVATAGGGVIALSARN